MPRRDWANRNQQKQKQSAETDTETFEEKQKQKLGYCSGLDILWCNALVGIWSTVFLHRRAKKILSHTHKIDIWTIPQHSGREKFELGALAVGG